MLSLFVRSIFVDNMIFAFFLGMCSYLAVSKNVKTALGLGIAVTFVLCVTVPVDYLLQTKVLAEDGILGIDLTYLAFILFIAVIAGIVQLVEMVVERFSPSLYAALGIFLPLIAVNCAIMGASLFMQQRIGMDPATSTQAISSVWDSLAYALGSGIGLSCSMLFMDAACLVSAMIFSSLSDRANVHWLNVSILIDTAFKSDVELYRYFSLQDTVTLFNPVRFTDHDIHPVSIHIHSLLQVPEKVLKDFLHLLL